MNKHNTEYSGGYPLAVGDKYYAQDLMRDINFHRSELGKALKAIFGNQNCLIYGGVVSQGSGYDRINVTALFGVVGFDVTIPGDWDSSSPPSTSTEEMDVFVSAPAITNEVMSSATLDGASTNYVKIQYAETTAYSRDRKKASGSYAYEKTPSYTITINTTPPTSKDLSIATLVGDGSTFLTITPRNTDAKPDPSSYLLEGTAGYVQVAKSGGGLEDGPSEVNVDLLDGDQTITGKKTFSNPETSLLGMSIGVLMSTVKWTERQTLDGNALALTYGNGLYIAGTSTGDSVWTSSDGITWTNRQTLDGSVISLTYGNGLFVAGTSSGNSVWTSPDGITWTNRQTLDGPVYALTYGNGLYIAGTSTGDSVWTSSDGITWTNRQTLDGAVRSLTYGNGLYIAGTSGDSVWTSSDGITWTNRQTLDGSVISLTYGNGLYIAGTSGDSVWTPGI
jgi:hypothetical protein